MSSVRLVLVVAYAVPCSASNGTKAVNQTFDASTPSFDFRLGKLFNLTSGHVAYRRQTFEEYNRDDEKPPRNMFSRLFAPAPGAAGGIWRPFGRSFFTRCECISRGPYIHTGPLRSDDVHGQVGRLGASFELMHGDVCAHSEQLYTIISQAMLTRRVVRRKGRTLTEAVANVTAYLTGAVANQTAYLTEAVANQTAYLTEAVANLTGAVANQTAYLTEAVANLTSSAGKDASAAAKAAAAAALAADAAAADALAAAKAAEKAATSMAADALVTAADAKAAEFRRGNLGVLGVLGVLVVLMFNVGMSIRLERRISAMAGCGSPDSPSFPRPRRPPPGKSSRRRIVYEHCGVYYV